MTEEDEPWDTRIPESTPPGTAAGTPVKLPDECAVCGEEFEFGGWHTLHGESECRNCGTPYQLKPTSEGDWDDVPRHKIKDEYLPAVKKCYEETGSVKGFDDWIEENPDHRPDTEEQKR